MWDRCVFRGLCSLSGVTSDLRSHDLLLCATSLKRRSLSFSALYVAPRGCIIFVLGHLQSRPGSVFTENIPECLEEESMS